MAVQYVTPRYNPMEYFFHYYFIYLSERVSRVGSHVFKHSFEILHFTRVFTFTRIFVSRLKIQYYIP